MRAFTVFWDAWKNRHKMGDDNHTRDLAAFLPAALEIQHAPANPLAKWLGRTLMVLFTLAVAWAFVGEVNIVASAEGKIIPSSRVKQIQPHEKAVVKAILVSEGQHVEKGQALIELDGALTRADEIRLKSELSGASISLAINTALLELFTLSESQQHILALSNITVELANNASLQDNTFHKQLLWQQWLQYQTQKQGLMNGHTKNEEEQASTHEILKKYQQTLPIIERRTENMYDLYQQGVVSEAEYLELQQQRIELTQDFAAEEHRLEQLKAAATEISEQLKTLAAQTQTETLTQITELRRQVASLEQELAKATDLHNKQILYAPVSGQVQELSVTTIGGVVTQAQELMLIVPDEEKLEVEVFLQNKDIGFVEEGMEAEIKIHTFPFTKYGLIEGEIISISDDATVDEERGLIYGMHIIMKASTIEVDKRIVKLMPGMEVTAEIKTGKRRILEFFMAPLLRYKEESIRER